jgi:serine carboxypeptidase-like clade 2
MSSQLCCCTIAMCVTILLQLCSLGVSLSHPNKIIHLPGQPHVEFHQFSGYVNVDNKSKKEFFFYFVEAQQDAASKPLVLWLNGGDF